MKERPILFSGPMIRAILAGRKTQTRRLSGVPPWNGHHVTLRDRTFWDPATPHHQAALVDRCPYGQAGDRLWVRETWFDDMPDEPKGVLANGRRILYRADHDCTSFEAGCPCNPDGDGKRSEWRPSIFLPRWASRITLALVSVRVERLDDITDEDAEAEGVDATRFPALWDAINGDRAPWVSNPWVWVVGFRRLP